MINIKRIKETNSEEYHIIEKLLISSFPIDEYRSIEMQRKNVENNNIFYMNIIYQSERPIGLISYWLFDKFIYIEHFAIISTIRNMGYGTKTINLLKGKQKSIVLEVEIPTNKLRQNRIEFYQRCGFTLCTKDYTQPAYRSDSKELPMFLMSYGIDINKNFDSIKNAIHREVYGKY